MTSAAPTIVAIETNSAWVVILAVSLVTMPVALLLRRLIGRPGALASSVLLGLPLALPLVAALSFQKSVLPEVSVLRPLAPELFEKPDWNLLHFMFVADARGEGLVPYAFTGAPGRWLFLLGVTFSSFMLLRRLAGAIALRRLIHRCEDLDPTQNRELMERVGRLSEASGLKQVPVVKFLPDSVTGAFVAGGRDGRILISPALIESLEPDELDAILAHELAHIAARDVPVMVVAGLLRDVVAWNPVAHLALRRLIAEREFEADRHAASLTGKPLAVASSLVKMCELMQVRSRFEPRPTLAFFRNRGRLRRRVADLLALADGRSIAQAPERIPYVVAACLAAVLGLQVGAQVAQQADFAIVWDAPDAASVPLWLDGRLSPQRTPVAGSRADRNKRTKQVKKVTFAGARFPVFGDGYALREADLGRWKKALSVWAKRKGYPSRMLMTEVDRSWRAAPVFATPRIGPFGFYRIDLFANLRVPGRQR
ncbi:MAG: M48 family metalloprotease [Actinomycetota bacterium]